MYKNNYNTHNNYVIGSLASKRLKDFFKIEKCGLFLETGTYKGDGVQWGLDNNFSKIYSVELNKELYEYSNNRFSDKENVKISCCDTLHFLKTVIPTIKISSLLYLDAHISGGDSSHNANHPVPLKQESEIILNHFYDTTKLIVVVDDVRLWEKQLIDDLICLYKNKDMESAYIDDSIVFCNENFLLSEEN